MNEKEKLRILRQVRRASENYPILNRDLVKQATGAADESLQSLIDAGYLREDRPNFTITHNGWHDLYINRTLTEKLWSKITKLTPLAAIIAAITGLVSLIIRLW